MLHGFFIYVGLTKSVLTLQADEELFTELEEDVREECIKFGPVDNVKVPPNPKHGAFSTCLENQFHCKTNF
jgi:hypothetical protein